MSKYRIAAVPGDGIGKEVIAAGIEVLNALAEREGNFSFEFRSFDWGSDYYKKHGVMMPADGEKLKPFDAIYFGAVSAPTFQSHHALGPAARDLPAVRSVRQCPSDPHPARHPEPAAQCRSRDLDWSSSVRTLKASIPAWAAACTRAADRVAQDVSIMTRPSVERIIRFAFGWPNRPRKLLTVVTKSNAQRHAMVMWDEIAEEIAAEFPDVTWDKMLVDAMTMRMTLKPGNLDTIVATNLHADILSDLAAALAGRSASRRPQTSTPSAYPSMFDRSHGSPSTSPAKASPTRSARSGLAP